MNLKAHEAFQSFLDKTLEQTISADQKMSIIQTHLLENQDLYQDMLLSCFDLNALQQDQYYYITFTYHDQPIDLSQHDEWVVSMLYDHSNHFYYEISLFNHADNEQEKTISFNRKSAFLN